VLDSLNAMDQNRVLDVFCAESEALAQVTARLSAAEWDRPTRCDPWLVRDLIGHLRVVIAWLPGMLAAPAPPEAGVSAAQYYRPDARFSPATNQARIALAQAAARAAEAAPAEDFADTYQEVARSCRLQPNPRVVRTRHGDPMLLADFLLTRVVEVAVHGLDVADAIDREPWLTRSAAELVQELLLGPDWASGVEKLGWDPARFLRKATGRDPLDAEEAADVERLGLRWLALG
jgi:uncharacterized protein (TIGR03083 family)